jgi:hypothetical protein
LDIFAVNLSKIQKMKNFLVLAAVMVLMSSCYTSRSSMQGGNHIRRAYDVSDHRLSQKRGVRVIESAHGRSGNIFFRQERPCSEQW